MQSIRTIRNRFAVPTIGSLLVTMVLGSPIAGSLVAQLQLSSLDAAALHLALTMALLAGIFTPLSAWWRRWLDGRPPLVLVRGTHRSVRDKPDRPGA
jgi:hypothetical protein